MDNFQIETAQNVSIKQNTAGIEERILAFLVDILIILVCGFVILICLPLTGFDEKGKFIFAALLGLPLFMYHLLWETFNNGQSVGKTLLKIRVVKKDGTVPAFSDYLIRWLLRPIDISFVSGGVAACFILFGGKGQRLGDLATGTTVITEKTKVRFGKSLFKQIPDSYIPKYPQVIIFNDQEMTNIRKIFLEAKSKRNHKVILELSKKIKTLMKIEITQKPLHFITQVIKDYQYYTQNQKSNFK